MLKESFNVDIVLKETFYYSEKRAFLLSTSPKIVMK